MHRVPPSLGATTTIRRSVCTCIFVRGRRPVAGWPHGRLIGLLDRDVPTTTTLLLLLCTGAHYSHKPGVALRCCERVQRSRVLGPRFITLARADHKRTPRHATHSSWRSTRWTRRTSNADMSARFFLDAGWRKGQLAREVSTTETLLQRTLKGDFKLRGFNVFQSLSQARWYFELVNESLESLKSWMMYRNWQTKREGKKWLCQMIK